MSTTKKAAATKTAAPQQDQTENAKHQPAAGLRLVGLRKDHEGQYAPAADLPEDQAPSEYGVVVSSRKIEKADSGRHDKAHTELTVALLGGGVVVVRDDVAENVVHKG